MLWRVDGKKLKMVETTTLEDQGIVESNLEDWIEQNPEILGEKLFIIGRQVQVADVADRLDLLALDRSGNAVIIELKRGDVDVPVDFQALRYASYVSRWGYEDFEKQAQAYFEQQGKAGEEFNFISVLEEFFGEEVPDINQEQRIIIVGRSVRQKLVSVALWLLEHKIDIKVVEITPYRDESGLYLYPRTILPPPSIEKIGPPPSPKKPWLVDGESWHLRKRCGPESRQMLLELNDLIQSMFDVDGPNWGQKFYVAFRLAGYNWITIDTHRTSLNVDILVKKGLFSEDALVEQLQVAQFDRRSPLSEKLQLESSVEVIPRGTHDRIRLRIKSDFDLHSEAFKSFLQQCYDAAPW